VSTDGNDQNYEDLKAKLGLKSPSATQQSDPDLTPAGGFDLGLQKSASELDSGEEIERQADQRASELEGPDLVVRESAGTRQTKYILVLVSVVLALGAGYAVKGVLYDRDIEGRQQTDAKDILNRIQSIKAVGLEQKLISVVDEHVEIVVNLAKKLDTVKQAKKITDALVKKVRADTEALIVQCRKFVKAGPSIDPKDMLKDSVFNGQAVREFLKLSKALNALYYASLAIAQEDGLLAEFEMKYDPESVVADSYIRAWRWAQWTDPEGRSRGHLVGVTIQKDDKGKIIFRKEEVKPRPGFKFKKGEDTFVWQIKVKYDNPKLVDGEAVQFTDTDVIVDWDLKVELTKAMRKKLGQHHEGYRINLIKRVMGRIAALRAAAEAFPPIKARVLKQLSAFAHNN
jgi:hypothetical protein